MADQKNSNQVVKKLKWLDMKEPDPSSLNVRELRGRNVNEKLHIPSIRQPLPGPIFVHSTVQILEKNICLLLPINQNTPTLVSTILLQSSLDLETDHSEIIDEMLKQVAQTVNQKLLKTTTYHTQRIKRKHKNICKMYGIQTHFKDIRILKNMLVLTMVSNRVSYTSLDGQLRNLYIITIIKGQLSKVKFKGQIY